MIMNNVVLLSIRHVFKANAARMDSFPIASARAPDPIGTQAKGKPHTACAHDVSIMAWCGIQASMHTG